MKFILIYTTNKNMAEAQKIANYLLRRKLIACANFFPIQSGYWWKNKIEKANEAAAIFKTKKTYWQKVKNEIKKRHSYQTPCIIKIDIEANKEYADYICSI